MPTPRTFSFCTVSIESHVATVTLSATGKANRMGPDFWRGMPELFAWLGDEDEVRAIVLRGEGEHFTFGLDLATMGGEIQPVLAPGAQARERLDLLEMIERMQRATSCVAACKKPVIAAVSGWCIGGGVDLITACDVRLCSAEAKFSVREIRLAMVADMGTLARLPAIFGEGAARELALTGDDFDAKRAARIGLVGEVYETPAALFDAARAMAGRMAANSPLVLAGVKRVMNAASERRAAESLHEVALWNAAFLASADLREAFTSFLEKRPAKYEGR